MTNTNESSGASVTQPLKRNSNDVGWDYGLLVDGKSLERVKCRLCGKVMSGGIHRLKEHVGHITGNVSKCLNATTEDKIKCRNAVEEARNKKKQKMIEEKLVREEVNIRSKESIEDELEEIEIGGVRKEPHVLGLIDRFAKAINPGGLQGSSKMRQKNINEALYKERLHEVHLWVTDWMFESGMPWNATTYNSFIRAVEAIGQFGPGYRPPTYYEVKETYLPTHVDRTKNRLKKQEEEWARTGCSVMTDAWTDRKRRSIMNLCVNCREGTTFLSSKECSDVAHTAEHIFKYVDECIEQVGLEKVVQVVTDNASNNMAAAKKLKDKRPNIFWTSCAAHTINLMLESIGKLPRFQKAIDQAKSLTIFIYAHHKTLAMMRSFTKKRDIVRPGKTRFASAFLTLQSLMEKKNALKTMFSSEEWEKCKFSKTSKGKLAYSTVMSLAFWNGVANCLKVFGPLVKVLRLVDGDQKPSMPWLYGGLRRVKQEIIEALNNVENNYQQIIEIIDGRMKDRLDTSLHKAAFVLNPYYHYKDSNLCEENEFVDAIIGCVDVFYHNNIVVQDDIINIEWPKYKKNDGSFGRTLAIKGCEDESRDPVDWWSNYGGHTPNLQKLAKRILALTTSSSGCERNWSTFEGIHTKKRNRLDSSRLNNLVYVQFNRKLWSKKERHNEKKVDVLLAADGDAVYAQGWLVKGGDDDDDEAELDTAQTRQLNEDEFVSEEEEKEEEEERQNINVEFESDHEQILEDNYGVGDDELMTG